VIIPNNVVETRKTIEAFVDVVEAKTLTAEERLGRLPRVLDSLALVAHSDTFGLDETDYPEEPREDYQATYEAVGRHFPTLGYYNVPDSITREIGESKIGVGDAIDDIVDILLDLKGVLWRFKNTSVDDALWDLNQSFLSHWGLHLRGL
jgi:hypothetical protein